ncbi:unnamed protein product [Paramecium octaurelia]|uniref:Uncharacterized protein n=1 Tax=Paramecium octaurelia TaxID=43137 RepID=A0A8S1VCT0_PAROT|nr:unnamed protein product [Paramecium octaurelia]
MLENQQMIILNNSVKHFQEQFKKQEHQFIQKWNYQLRILVPHICIVDTIKILKLMTNKLKNESLKYLIQIYEDQKYITKSDLFIIHYNKHTSNQHR